MVTKHKVLRKKWSSWSDECAHSRLHQRCFSLLVLKVWEKRAVNKRVIDRMPM